MRPHSRIAAIRVRIDETRRKPRNERAVSVMRHNDGRGKAVGDRSMLLQPGALALADLRAIWSAPTLLSVHPASRARVDAAAACVDRVISSGATVYGVNTGFGL